MNDCYLYHCLNALDICGVIFVPLATNLQKIKSERTEYNEYISKDKVRKTKIKNYQPNYFLSIRITNKEVLFFFLCL